MRYTGRIATSGCSAAIYVLWMAYCQLKYGGFIKELYIGLVLTSIAVWWLGKQYDKAKFYSEKDDLSGAYNRRFVYTIIPKLFALTQRKQDSLSVLIVDIDNFKYINDTYGHHVGDTVLTTLASILLTSTRKGDIVARWGGDEFLVVAMSTDKAGTKALIERIKSSFEEQIRTLGFRTTVSIGYALYPDDGGNLDQLMQEADKFMYRRKHS